MNLHEPEIPMTASDQPSNHSPSTGIAHLCLDCICFCHDLIYTETGQLHESHGCKNARDRQHQPMESSLPDEFHHAQAIESLREASRLNRQIAFTGLEQLSLESQKAALDLAENLHAWVLSGNGTKSVDPWAIAFAQKGGWYASWTEIRHRSDGLILWFAPLWSSHPRWLERFGPKSRLSNLLTILPPDEVATDSGLINEQQILLDPAHALIFLADLRTALKHGHENISDSRIRRLSQMFQDSHWLTWVRSEDPEGLIDPLATAESITEMIGQSNSPTRRVVMADVPHSLNPQGLKAVLSWRSGLTAPMWFSPEGPVYRPSEFSVDNSEVVVAFGDRPTLQSGQTALWFSPSSVTEMPANITQIPVAELGFDDSGTIVRADGVALQVPSKVISRRIKTAEFLSNIRNALNLQSTTGGVSR